MRICDFWGSKYLQLSATGIHRLGRQETYTRLCKHLQTGCYSFTKTRETITNNDDMKAENKILKMT